MNSQAHKRIELELDLWELIWRLLSQWKAILIVSVMAALLACAMKHGKDMQTYEAKLAAEEENARIAELSVDERIAKIMGALSEEDRSTIGFLLNEQVWIDEQKAYLNDSVIMRTDPTNQRMLAIVFNIKTNDDSKLQELFGSYDAYVQSEEITESIKPFIAPEIETKYINEIIKTEKLVTGTADGESNARYTIRIILPEDTDAQAVADTIESKFEDYASELMSTLPHSIKRTSDNEYHIYDSENVNKRIAVFNNINALITNYNLQKTSLTDKQASTLTAIMTLEAADKADGSDNTSTAPAEGEKAAKKTVHKPRYSKKAALLGFMLAIFIYAIIYTLLLVLKGRVNSAADAENYTNSRLLGEVYYPGEYKGLQTLFHSRIVENLHHREKTDVDKQLKGISSVVDAICGHKGVKDLYLLDFLNNDANSKKVIEDLTGVLKERVSDVSIINGAGDINEKDLDKANQVIFLLSNEVKAATLFKALGLCGNYDADCLGSIWVGEV